MPDFMEIPELVSEWLTWAEFATHQKDEAHENPHLAGFGEFMFLTDKHPERAWEAICAVVSTPEAEPYLGLLGAGPVEDLLGQHGPLFVDRIEHSAKTDPRFARMLSHVWRFTINEDIWKRIEASRIDG